MKVLMIAPQPFLEPRGTPISVYQRARGLGELGHSVDLVTYHVGRHVDIPGVTIHRCYPVPFIKQVKVGPSWYKPFLDVSVLARTMSLLARNRYDVIHSHEEASFFAVPLAAMFRTRHLYDMHSSLPKQLENFNFANVPPVVNTFERMERWVINTADAVITIGSDLEEYVRTMNPGVPHVMIENQAVNGIDGSMDAAAVDALKQRLGIGERLAIVYTGTFERYQGINLLIEGAKQLVAEHPNVVYVMVGGKPHQVEEARAEAVKHGVAQHFIFTGIVPIEDVNTYTQLADILVSPRVEGTSVPLKIYSYMHSGKPIVATNKIAHTIVLNDETSVLTDPTAEAFAEGLALLLRDPALRERIGLQAQEYAREFHNARTYLSKLQQIYASLGAPNDSLKVPA